MSQQTLKEKKEKLRRIRELISQKKTNTEIAKKLQCSQSSIKYLITKYKISQPNKRTYKVNIETLKRLLSEGKHRKDIASIMKVTVEAIGYHMRRLELKEAWE